MYYYYPDGDFMGRRKRMIFVRVYDAVFPDGHCVCVNLLGDAFRVPRMYLVSYRERHRR